MSNSLFMDESNGNGVYASKSNNSGGAAATTQSTNNINNIMNAATATTTMATTTTATANTLPTSISSEDLSQSLSEYTDADESISAPTEFLAETGTSSAWPPGQNDNRPHPNPSPRAAQASGKQEQLFLSAVMLKDYKKALKYCKLILQYEPNNATAKEFYPLIQDKLKGAAAAATVAASSDSDENDNKSSSPEMGLELQPSTEPSAGESDEASDDQRPGLDNDNDEFGCEDGSSSSGMVEESISEDEDDDDEEDVEDGDDEEDDVEAEEEDDVDDDIEDEDDDDEDDDVEDANSSSGDDLPIDENHVVGEGGDGGGIGHGGGNDSNSSRHSSSGGDGRSRSDNTTHSYSSLLLEEEEADDLVPANLNFCKELPSPDIDVSNGNKIHSTSCSDSESPTEPLTQRLAAILRSKCGVVNSDGDNY